MLRDHQDLVAFSVATVALARKVVPMLAPVLVAMPVQVVMPVQEAMLALKAVPAQVAQVATNLVALTIPTPPLLPPRLLQLKTLLPLLMLAPRLLATAARMTALDRQAILLPLRAPLVLTLRPLLPLRARTLVLALAPRTSLEAMLALVRMMPLPLLLPKAPLDLRHLDPATLLPPKVLLVPRILVRALDLPTSPAAMTAALRAPIPLLLLPTSRWYLPSK